MPAEDVPPDNPGLDPVVAEFLRDLGCDEDDLLIHGLGSDIDLIPPHLVRAREVLGNHFQTTDGLRFFLSNLIASDSSVARVHGAIKILKKVGAGEPGGMDYSGLLAEPLMAVLHREPLAADLYADALMLLNYCDETSPLSDENRRKLVERSRQEGVSSMSKFCIVVNMLARKWEI